MIVLLLRRSAVHKYIPRVIDPVDIIRKIGRRCQSGMSGRRNGLRWLVMHLSHGIEFHKISLYDRWVVGVHYCWRIGNRSSSRGWRWLWGWWWHVIHVGHLEFWRMRLLLLLLTLWLARIMLWLLLILLWLLNRLLRRRLLLLLLQIIVE